MVAFEDLIEKIKKNSIDPETAGRAFFAGNFTDEETKTFLTAYLEAKRYEHLAAVIHCGFIHKEYNNSDYITSRTAEPDLASRYFHMLLELAASAEVGEAQFAPLLIACFSAPPGSYLHAWKKASETYLLKEAYRDYDRILTMLTTYDLSYNAYDILMQVDKNRTEELLKERLLYGKNIRKTAIRKLLLGYKIDVAYLFGADYKTKEIPMREAIVRLALLYKNDLKAAEFLASVKNTEPVAHIRKLITSGENHASKGMGNADAAAYLEQMMIDSKRITPSEFYFKLEYDCEFAKSASSLFFSVYSFGRLIDIVIVHNGTVCNLENAETVIAENAEVGVLHPLELPTSDAYLKRLNIEQPFVQIRRPVFIPSDYEAASNVVSRLKGTVISAGEFRKNLKTFDFRLLHGSKEGVFDRAVAFLGDCACVLEFSPTDFADKKNIVMLGETKFYSAKDFISVRGNLYIEGVPSKRVSDIDPKRFSELLYVLYRAGNVQM